MAQTQDDAQKLVKGRGAQAVYQALKREILSLILPPGAPLDETSLAERFAMSRSPIREALVRLSAEGLVDMLSNRASLVAALNMEDLPRYVEALDFLQRINTRLAAQNHSGEDVDTMLHHAKAFDRACVANDYLDMSATNRDFHLAIAQAGKNAYLTRSYGQLLDEGRRMLHMHFDYIKSSTADTLLGSEHQDMIDAIRNRDVARADRLAHEHTRQFHKRFIEFLSARYATDFDFALSTLPQSA